MKDLITQYLKHTEISEIIIVDYYNIDGANCSVAFYTDEACNNKDYTNINVWDFINFLHTN